MPGHETQQCVARPSFILTTIMQNNSTIRTEPAQPVRQLKIEAAGDFFRGLIKPKIRLMGRWLERAGFQAGNHVEVAYVAPGVIELRCSKTLVVNPPQPI